MEKRSDEKPPRREEILMEASYWHLPIIPFHTALQKVRGFAVWLNRAGEDWFKSLKRHIFTPKPKGCQGQN
jgi:hypothetical protein